MSDGDALPSKSSCQYYNTWRYGFDNFTGTSSGLESVQDYFKQYISRDIISIVGYQDTDASGDTYCMAEMQGGTKRRDRNLAWWQYINTLAKTDEDLAGFPATFGNLPDWSNISNNEIHLQLVVVESADHNADEVFASSEGQAALFSSSKMPTGWRPAGWMAATKTNSSTSSRNGSPSAKSPRSSSANTPIGTVSSATVLIIDCFYTTPALVLTMLFSLALIM